MLWGKGNVCIYIYMKKTMQNIHIHRHCLWPVGARRAPTQNWIHWYTEVQLLHVRNKHPGRKGISCMAYKVLSWWLRTHLQVSEVKCCPWIMQKQTCGILNFPNLHQLADFTHNGSMLYLFCEFLLEVWGTVRLIKYFNKQNWWLHFRVSSPATPLFQHSNLLLINQGLFMEVSH